LHGRLFPTARLGKSPYEAWTGQQPDISRLKAFGTKVKVHIPKADRKKLDPNAKDGIFVGYGCTASLYRVAIGKRVSEYRDISWNEMPKKETKTGLELEDSDLVWSGITLENNSEGERESSEIIERERESLLPINDEENQAQIDAQIEQEIELESSNSEGSEEDIPSPIPSRTSSRRNIGIRAPRFDEEEFPKQRRRNAFLFMQSIPPGYSSAIHSSQKQDWELAMDREMKSIRENETWTVIPNKGQKTIKCRWVYTRKTNGLFKARLVAKGYSQVYGLDYIETFAPVVKWSTIRFLFAIAAFYDLDLIQMDVVTAFLYGDLKETIYMDLPPGYSEAGKICKLRKSLYGLKQSPRQWYQKLEVFLLGLNFRKSTADPCLFIRGKGLESSCFIAIYVDDLAICGSPSETLHLQEYLVDTFKMKDLGDLELFLGIEVERDRANRTISLSNSSYLEKILRNNDMEACNGVSTPLPPGLHLKGLEKDKSGAYIGIIDHSEYQALVGSVIYASTPCRPDISYAVGAIARFMHAPGSEHWAAAKHLLRYIQRTKETKLVLGKEPNQKDLVLYSDSDYAGDRDTRKSTTGFVSILYGGAISWKSQLQKTVAQSTMESEYIALAQATKESLWLSKLILDFHGNSKLPTTLYSDNTAAQILAKNPENHERAKHIDTKYHLVRDEVEEERIKLEDISSKENIADILTKPLPIQTHRYLSKKLGLLED
jgi:Reverse transcriptase (RNA-dependent DNA polymerase)